MRLGPISLFDYEARAQQVLPHAYWEFIAGGAKDEITTRRNRTALDAISLRPRMMRDVTERKLETTVLGTPISFPVMVAPAGGHKIAHLDGECATARGTELSRTLMMLSTSSHYSLEEVAEATRGPLWFQLYHRGYELTETLARRAEDAGYKAVVLTVDTPLPAPKERDIRNRYLNPFPLGNFNATTEEMPAMSGTDEAPNWQPARVPPLTWKELEWLRSLTRLPLVLKGVRTAEDARVAVECGVNGILVSTHGGRQMDATLSAVESLPEVAEVCKGKAEVYLDSGVRRGSDVLKALALGARAVAVGRPLYWGLAVNGAEGVHGVLEILRSELDQAMGFCGQTDVQNLDPALVTVPHGWGNGRMYP
jgi:isopentenyl diphosphate isomerase/L-lactate dehydrogenase-like FMN-dependent dehydrogenase